MFLAENIEDGKEFHKDVSLQVVPVGIGRSKELVSAIGVRIMKKTSEISPGVIDHSIILFFSEFVIGPGVDHLRHIAIIRSHPTIKNGCHHLQEEEDDKLGIVEARTVKKIDLRDQPGKQNQVKNKKKILQAANVY